MQNPLPTARGILGVVQQIRRTPPPTHRHLRRRARRPGRRVAPDPEVQPSAGPGTRKSVSASPSAEGPKATARAAIPGAARARRGKNKRPKHNAISPNARRAKDVLTVEGVPADEMENYKSYEELTTVMPAPRLTLEYPDCPPACRLIDLFCPIGYGTRGMIVSPPKAGKDHAAAEHRLRHQQEPPRGRSLRPTRRRAARGSHRLPSQTCRVPSWLPPTTTPWRKHIGLAMLALETC